KEASSLRFVFPCGFSPERIMLICHWIIDTLVETLIRRWCCHVGGDRFTPRWQIVTLIRQRYNHHWLTILFSTTQMSIPITEIAVYIMSKDGARHAWQGNRCHQHQGRERANPANMQSDRVADHCKDRIESF